MAYTDQLALLSDQTFRDRITMAMVTAALNVQGEAETADSPTFYAKRSALAVGALTSPSMFADRFVWAVAANPAINADSSDSDIQYTVNSVFSDLAGVMASEGPTS
jgi:hypothetical protein